MCAGMWSLYEDYSRSAVAHMCSVAGIFVQRHVPFNVECMDASGNGHIVHCIEFIWGRYTDIVVWYLHMK